MWIAKAFVVIGMLFALSPGVAFADVKSGEAKSFLCDLCHNTGNHGEAAPILQGQPAPYLVLQLQAFKDKKRVASCRPMCPARAPKTCATLRTILPQTRSRISWTEFGQHRPYPRRPDGGVGRSFSVNAVTRRVSRHGRPI